MENNESTKIFSTNFKHLRESRGITSTKIAEMLNVSQSTISTWENGIKLPRADALDKITRFFNISLSDLMSAHDKKENMLTIKVPSYGSVAAGALAEIDGETENDVCFINIPINLLGSHANDKGLFMMKVNGESMNKVIPNGSYVIAKPDNDPQENDIVIFSHDEGYSLKRFRPYDIAGSVLFKAETTDSRIKDIVINLDDEIETRIYGKVIWYGVALE